MIISLPGTHFDEGYFTIDVLVRFIRSTLFDPILTFLLIVYQIQSRTRILTQESTLHSIKLAERTEWIRDVWMTKGMLISLGIWTVGLGYKFNEQLSRAARNNFKASGKGWDQFKDQVVVLTGGAGGLGQEVIKQLNERQVGFKIAVFDLAEFRTPLPKNVSYYKVDISSSEAVKEAAEKVRKELGTPTILINMAGVVRAKSILDMSEKDIDLTYDINVKSHYYTVQNFLPAMIQKGFGHVVTIASSTGYHQAANGVAYCSSKAAALSFHEGLTEELRHVYLPHRQARRIRTSIVCPAHIKTKMFEGFDNAIPGFFAPSLEVSTVGRLVVQTVLSGESQHIIEPVYAKFTPVGRALPTWLYGFILACARRAMGGVRDVQRSIEKEE